jgi:hypothetical protein
MIPPHAAGTRVPLILYQHCHGGEFNTGKNELVEPGWPDGTTGGQPTLGEDLVARGYAVLCIDEYAFGERQGRGPNGLDGKPLTGNAERAGLDALFQTEGRTINSMMARDNMMALDWALTLPDVDPKRVATMGMSMGGATARTQAFADPRISAVVSVAALSGDDWTGLWLLAPVPMLTMNGDNDPGSAPVHDPAWFEGAQSVKSVYGLFGVRNDYVNLVSTGLCQYPGCGTGPGLGHDLTVSEVSQALAFLDAQFQREPTGPWCSGLPDGLYCGSALINGDPNTLYACSGGAGPGGQAITAIVGATVSQVCAGGCEEKPVDANDACK